jgi:hypothetical protein
MGLSTSYSKAETENKLQNLKKLFGSGLHEKPLKITDPTPTQVGGYVLSDVGNYSFGTTLPNKWNVAFLSASGWEIVSLSIGAVSPQFNADSETEAQGGKQIAYYIAQKTEVLERVFNDSVDDLGIIQKTTSGIVSTTAVTNVHGISIAIGKVPNMFNKINVSFAQNSATPITQIEVRLFEGKTVGGALIAKKRQTVATSVTSDFNTTIQFDSNIDYDGEIWLQVLTNNPFSYKRISPAVQRTQALGYGAPFVTTINNLDATNFPNSQGWTDIYFEFNTIDEGIKLTDEGKAVVLNSVTERKFINITANYTALNNFLKSDGTLTVSQNWRTTEQMNLPVGTYLFYGRNTTVSIGVVGYKSDNSIVALVPTGDFSVTPHPFTITSDIVYIRACGYIDQPPKIMQEQVLVKDSLIAKDARVYVPLTWNCLGHSIWANDGVTISGTTFYEGIQTHVRRIFKFEGYNKYCYSGHSLGAQSLADTSSLGLKLNVFTDGSKGFWTIDTITNDFRRDIPIGTLSDYNNATGVLTYYGALRAFRDRVIALQPAGFVSRVIAFNALRRDNAGYTSTSVSAVSGHSLLDYEKAIMNVCVLNGWEFVDQFRQSEITQETLSITTNDGLHPNNFGYNLAKKPVINAISLLIKEYGIH